MMTRLAQIVPTVVLVSLLVFGLQQLMPGDPALVLAGEERGDPKVLAQIRSELWLDRSLPEQYVHWAGNVLRGNLGYSWRNREPVTELIAQKLPVTAQLAVMAFIIAVWIGVPMAQGLPISALPILQPRCTSFWPGFANRSPYATS